MKLKILVVLLLLLASVPFFLPAQNPPGGYSQGNPYPFFVSGGSLNLTGQTANIAQVTFYVPPKDQGGSYLLACFGVVTNAGGNTSATLPDCEMRWTDADAGVAEPVAGRTANVFGTHSGTPLALGAQGQGGGFMLPRELTNAQILSTGYASAGGTGMQYNFYLRTQYVGAPLALGSGKACTQFPCLVATLDDCPTCATGSASSEITNGIVYTVPPGEGSFYQVWDSHTITTPAGTSSTIPGMVFSFTDGDTGIVKGPFTAGGNDTLNSLGTNVRGGGYIYAKPGTQIRLSTDGTYASSPANAMQYSAHWRLIALGPSVPGGTRPQSGGPVGTIDLLTQTADVPATVLYNVPSNGGGVYAPACSITVTQAATSSSTLPSAQVNFTFAGSNTATTVNMSNTVSTNTVGTHACNAGGGNTIIVPPGTQITVGTSGYASSGATPMQFAVHWTIRYIGP